MSQNKKIYWILFFVAFAISMFTKPEFCFLLIGSLAFCLGVYAIVFIKRTREKGIACTGRILSYEIDSEGDKTPIVEFTPPGGVPVTGTPHVYAKTESDIIRSYKKQVDQKVVVLYDPDDPKKFILSQDQGMSYLAFAFIILGGLAGMAVGVCSLLGYIKLS